MYAARYKRPADGPIGRNVQGGAPPLLSSRPGLDGGGRLLGWSQLHPSLSTLELWGVCSAISSGLPGHIDAFERSQIHTPRGPVGWRYQPEGAQVAAWVPLLVPDSGGVTHPA